MDNIITIEMQPTDESLSLIRLIMSYLSQLLDFDIEEIDQIKKSITIILSDVQSINLKNCKLKLHVEFSEQKLVSTIILPNKYDREGCDRLINELIIKYNTEKEKIAIIETEKHEVSIKLKFYKKSK
jgi:hypothetical protein